MIGSASDCADFAADLRFFLWWANQKVSQSYWPRFGRRKLQESPKKIDGCRACSQVADPHVAVNPFQFNGWPFRQKDSDSGCCDFRRPLFRLASFRLVRVLPEPASVSIRQFLLLSAGISLINYRSRLSVKFPSLLATATRFQVSHCTGFPAKRKFDKAKNPLTNCTNFKQKKFNSGRIRGPNLIGFRRNSVNRIGINSFLSRLNRLLIKMRPRSLSELWRSVTTSKTDGLVKAYPSGRIIAGLFRMDNGSTVGIKRHE